MTIHPNAADGLRHIRHFSSAMTQNSARSNTIEYNGTNYFLNGINLAWNKFGNDFGAGAYNPSFFEQMFSKLQNYHVRELRYWVHCGGYHAMNYPHTNGYVTGLSSGLFQRFR